MTDSLTPEKIARAMFAKRGNHSEMHISEADLAGIIAGVCEFKDAHIAELEKERDGLKYALEVSDRVKAQLRADEPEALHTIPGYTTDDLIRLVMEHVVGFNFTPMSSHYTFNEKKLLAMLRQLRDSETVGSRPTLPEGIYCSYCGYRYPQHRSDCKSLETETSKPQYRRICPTCNSHAPHLHPAVQSGGEVHFCLDEFHLQETPQNRPEYIEQVKRRRAERSIETRESK